MKSRAVHGPLSTVHRVVVRTLVCCTMLARGSAAAWAETLGETKFFADCPHGQPLHLHHETHPWDLHNVLFTTLGVAQLEVFRVADGLIDLPLPGTPLHPFQRTTAAIRSGYHRLPPWRLTQRVGELVDAFQIPELSLGDASATYSVTTGDIAGPGSGMVIRVHKLIDWIQHVTGDLNRLGGRCVGRPQGIVTWSLPERTVDGIQWLLLKTFNRVGVLLTRTIDGTLTGVEVVGEHILNAGYRLPHQQETVFLRLPVQMLREQEAWLDEHRAQFLIGTPEGFARTTHAALAHGRRGGRPPTWTTATSSADEEPTVIVMMTIWTLARAPAALRSYVVPAAWVLKESDQ